jgi:hypothetical protein
MSEDKEVPEIQRGIQQETPAKRRRQLLPLWIKIFLWFFIVMGCMVPLGFILACFNIPFQVSLYGLTSNDPTSVFGILLSAVLAYKAYTAFALWTGKTYAVSLAQIDAIFGIISCAVVMIVGPGSILRLELIALIPYLIKMNKIKAEWIQLQN